MIDYIEKISILIIVEGSEEYDYLDRLNKLGLFSSKFKINITDAKSIDNIIVKFEYQYQLGYSYKYIFIVSDTEEYPYIQFERLKDKVSNIIEKEEDIDNVLYFTNPCTLEVILSHFDRVKLEHTSKITNAPIVERLTGVKDYRATEKQRKELMNKINESNYLVMKNNISTLSVNYKDIPSSNLPRLFLYLDGEINLFKEK